MAASYFTISLSPNIEESNDGSLICRDAVLGRTGWQTYRVGDLPQESAEELGIDLSDPDAEIDLYRPAEEVFSADTLASIEGKTVTDDHPQSEDGNVNPDNFKQFACGHVQNVRRGKEPLESGDYPLLGDVHIKAEPLLSDVRNHIKRELSLGYDYEIRRNGKRVEMHHITVNHCAVVPRGRAGREGRINDSELPAKKGVASRGQTAIINKAGERRPVKLTWKHIFGAGIKAHAADAEPEELAEATMDAMEKHMRHEDDEKDARDSRAKDRKARDKHEDDRGRDRHADDRKRDRVHDALDRLMDGRAKDTDLDELRDLLDEFFEEEQEEPEHEEDRGRDRRGRDKRGRDSRKARDKRADDGDGAEEEAEQTPKIEVEHLRNALSKDESEEHEDEHEHEEEESHEDDSTHEHDEAHKEDSDEDQNEPISEDWREDEPEEDQFEEDRARDKRGRDKARDRGRAHDGALAVLKTFRPFVARSQDKALRAAYDAALKEIAKASKPRSAGYGDFAARARAHDSSPRVSSEVKQAQELDSIFEKARTEGRK
ncbi:MAG: DUF2213 domain-containing protein [Pseudomonadota bacterium]|jgi:hypothetical protein|nr:DUF2213 domain-containing protein [Pseudomonadota bacterium]